MYLTVRNFDGTQLQEFHALSVGKGEILTEIDPIPAEVTQIVNGWSKVKNQRGSIGFVPSPLLKQLNNSSWSYLSFSLHQNIFECILSSVGTLVGLF